MSAPRQQSCLIVLSAANEGVSAQSFAQAYNLANPSFTIQLTSPNGKSVEFINQDDTNRRWFNEFRAKSNSVPISLDTIDPVRYSAMLIPDCPGGVHDLAHNNDLQQIVRHFVKEKKPICAVGMGVAALCCVKSQGSAHWDFEDYSLTSTSLSELARNADFPTLPIIIADFIRDNGAKYSCSGEADAVHIVIDRHVITGQNVQSTITAVQNLVLMCTQKERKPSTLR